MGSIVGGDQRFETTIHYAFGTGQWEAGSVNWSQITVNISRSAFCQGELYWSPVPIFVTHAAGVGSAIDNTVCA